MAQKNIAIYITSDVIRICQVEKTSTNVYVNRVLQTNTPKDSVEDGLIVDVDRVAEAIQEVLEDNQIKKGKIAFTIFSRKIANKEIELPYVSSTGKIQEMIEANMEDYFPMGNLHDYMTRYTILDKVEVEGRKFYKISVVAVLKEMVASYYELGKALKMPVVTVDYQVNSLYHLLKWQVKGSGTTLVLQMDNDTTHVSIMNGQAQLFRRSIPYGSDMLIQNLAAFKGITEEEAETIFKDAQLLDKNLSLEEYSEIVQDMSSAVARVVEFYTSKNTEVNIEQAKLYGKGAELVGLGTVLEKVLGISVETILTLHNVSIKKNNKYGMLYSEIYSYLPNIGAMIYSLDLKVEEEGKKKKGSGYGIFFFLLGTAVVFSIAFTTFIYLQTKQLNKEKAHLEESIAKLKVAEDVYNSYMNAKKYFEIVQNFDKGTENNNEALHSLILKLEEIMPESVGITGLSTKDGEVAISGVSSGKEPLALYVIALKELPFVSNVRVDNIRDTYDEFGKVSSSFSMTFQIRMIEEEPEATELLEGGEQE